MSTVQCLLDSESPKLRVPSRGGRGGSKPFFCRIHFDPRAPQVPLVIGETFGKDVGPRSPTGFEPCPAQLLRPK